jgi:hypothetical protein
MNNCSPEAIAARQAAYKEEMSRVHPMTFEQASRTIIHLASMRGIATDRNPNSLRYWAELAPDEQGVAEFRRRLALLLAVESPELHGDERMQHVMAWARENGHG